MAGYSLARCVPGLAMFYLKEVQPNMKKSFALLMFCGAVILAGCNREKVDAAGDKVVRRDENPDYVRLNEEGQQQMDAAIVCAQKEIDVFIAGLNNPKPSQTYFSVKKPFPYQDGDKTNEEHIWLTDVTYADGVFSGRVGNDPVDVENIKLGDKVTVKKAEASDWMIIDGGKLVGGYTIRVLRDRMAPGERRVFDESVPFKFD